MLDNQKAIFDKAGLRYNPNKNQKYLRNMVSKQISFTPKTAYYKLDKVNKIYVEYNYMDMHISHNCTIKKMWVPKEKILVTNPKRPNKTWVPKILT